MILSRLTLKETVRTSVLSHKWKNLWKFFTGSMDFDVTKIMVLSTGHSEAYIRACQFRYYVNQVLNCHQGESIEGLRVVCDLRINSTDDIDRWIDFAIIKKVQRLELDFSRPIAFIQGVGAMYFFPYWLLELPLHHSSFGTLTSLRLKSINVTEEVLTYFLSNFPLLEQFCVHDAPAICRFRVSGARLKLKQLEITSCENLKDLKISAAELVDFKYAGPIIDLPLEDVPLLSSVILGGDYCHYIVPRFEVLSVYISQLERLVLNVTNMMIQRFRDFPERLPEFSKLRQLEINFIAYNDQCILCLSSFVHASPRLCKFALKYTIDWSWISLLEGWTQTRMELFKLVEERHRRALKKCSHENLKVVEFRGWVGLRTDFELAMHLFEICVSLDKIIIDPLVDDWMEPEKIKAARERARELSTNIPHGANLIIL